MKTLLLNDTRSAEHVGCELVMRNTLRECARVGIDVLRTFTTADCKEPLIERLKAETFDAILINGEGSMHDDRLVPTHLCEAASWAKAEGKRVMLYNSLWEANEALSGHLESFAGIFCRDSVSAGEVRKAGGICEVVPDMIFASEFGDGQETGDHPNNELTFIDSIDRKKSAQLSKLATRQLFPFLHMDRIGFERLKKRFFVRTGWFEEHEGFTDEFVQTIRLSKQVVSGRFHGTCLAMALGVPVVSVSSNTRKLETLHADAGMDPSLVLTQVPKRIHDLDASFDLAKASLPAAKSYANNARAEIGTMFDKIAGLLLGKL